MTIEELREATRQSLQDFIKSKDEFEKEYNEYRYCNYRYRYERLVKSGKQSEEQVEEKIKE